MYDKIYDFCSVRNLGGIYKNGSNPTPRVKFLIELLKQEGIDFKVDKFPISSKWCILNKSTTTENFGFNIILPGSSSKMVVAHHDIVNANIDNANDNSASVINAIMIKKLMPEINVVILDGEEVGGLGSQRCSDMINSGDFGKIDWVLNLELTGKGGKHFFIGNYPGTLYDHIKSLFYCPTFNTPYNDSVTFRRNGIDSVVINPLPVTDKITPITWTEGVYLDHTLLYNCHTQKDTLISISTSDMKEFVEEVVLKILS